MDVKLFETFDDLIRAVLQLLEEHFVMETGCPHMVMLPGGVTPLRIYSELEKAPLPVSSDLYLMVTDERYVSKDSNLYNFGKMKNMVNSLGLAASRVLRVNTDLEYQKSVTEFERGITSFLDDGGRITLGLLGLGVDGHTASLFSSDDVLRGQGRYAMAVQGHEGPDRVSVTVDLLSASERIIFLAAGPGKADVVRRLMETPSRVVAGKAVAGVDNVEIWYSKERAK